MRSLLFIPVLLIIFAFKSDCIWKGKEAKLGDFTYIATFRYRGRPPLYSPVECSGSILNDHYILTSAWCAVKIDIDDMYTYIGSIDLTKRGMNYTIEEIIVHEKYNRTPYYSLNDIAVVRTVETIKFAPGKVTTVKLTRKDRTEGGIKANVSGYDHISFKTIRTVDVMFIFITFRTK